MANTHKLERNYWPHSIIGGIILIIIACAATIKIALDHPVQMDSFYMEKYQNVDRNINEIRQAQQVFDANFALEYATKKFILGEESTFSFQIIDKNSNKAVSDAQISLLLTRPETNEFNQEYTLKSAQNGVFSVSGITVDKPGRWQILTKINIDDKSSFNKYEVYATN